MSPHVESSPFVVAVLKTLTLILGGLITYYSYKAYIRTQAKSLRALTFGFGLVTLGSLLAGITDIVFEFGLEVNTVIESSLTVAGFAVILYSLYARE